MDTYSGAIQMLGNSSVGDYEVDYSIIEVGSHVLQNIKIPKGLDSYLSTSHKNGSNLKLWVSRNRIMGIEVDGGKSYYAKIKVRSQWYALLVGSIPFTVILIGFYPLIGSLQIIIQAKMLNSGMAELSDSNALAIECYLQ